MWKMEFKVQVKGLDDLDLKISMFYGLIKFLSQIFWNQTLTWDTSQSYSFVWCQHAEVRWSDLNVEYDFLLEIVNNLSRTDNSISKLCVF